MERLIQNKQRKINFIWFIPLAVCLYVLADWILIRAVRDSGTWPSGDDVMYHIHRGQQVYEAVRSGHFWVRLDTSWYNGVEILRYWSPLPAYVMALCIALVKGKTLYGYLVFTAAVYFLSALSWLIVGIRRQRPWMGFFLGLIWFFMPQNVMYYFQSGNLAGMLGNACVLPLMTGSLGEFLETPGAGAAVRLSIMTALMALCHSGFALLAMAVCLLWILFRKLMDRRERSGMGAIVAMVLGFLLTGVWFLASRSGVGSVDYSEQLKNSFQSLFTTLNPIERYTSHFAHYYFGLAAFLAAVGGLFLARKKSDRAGFLTAAVVCLLTSLSAYRLIRILPGGSFLWTSRMINTALALIFFCVLDWRSLKKPLQGLLAFLLAADCVLSFPLIYGNRNGAAVTSRLNDEQNATLLSEAKKITKQRITLIDASSLGATGAYLTSDWNSKNQAVFGAGYEAAVTRKNITMLNRAASDGNYLYLFDRSLELGSDTIVIQKARLYAAGNDTAEVSKAASAVGYRLVDSNDDYLLYHMETHGTFGVVTDYSGIAIGTAADEISENFPLFKEGDSTDLSSYSYQTLSKYKTVFLDGFSMSDRDRAEKMVKKLSEHGTRIFVAADGIPEDRSTRAQTFLGVTCSPISFTNGYPEMETDLGRINMELFPSGTGTWNTVYMNGLDSVLGSVEDNGASLAFYGTKHNKNIVFMGFNLSYYYALTRDVSAEKLLSEGMSVSGREIPKRTVVPVEIKEFYNGVTIKSGSDRVDTALAYHDIFSSRQKIWREHNLTYVNRGTTVIRYRWPQLPGGIAITVAAVVGIAVQGRRYRKRK